MAISSRRHWARDLRNNRSHRHRHDHENSHIQLDLSKELKENVKEALTNICLRYGVSSIRKLGYLNAIGRLVSENASQDYGISQEELFCCLRVALIQEATQIRAAALKWIRYLLKKQEDVLTLNKLQYPYFIARSMDINLRNEVERMQALRLVRRILVLSPKQFSPILARSLISLTNGGVEDQDRTFRVFLATLCELGVLNSALLISCGGVGTLARSATSGLSPAMVESVIGVLVRLLSFPETRLSVSLLCLVAPYCELNSLSETSEETRESRFSAYKLALLCVLRSYAGVLNFCNPHDNSGLKAIADILYVEQLEVRGAVLELFYELLGLPLPIWTDEPDVALAAVDPSRPRDDWRLTDGFVAAEGKSILPSLASHCPNITEIHLALLVYVLLECGLHRALAETIVTSDTFISVRAAVLLGAILHLAHSLLPPDVCDLTPPLPNLLEHASAGRHQALAGVAILGRMHSMMRKTPAPSSLYLDRIIQAGTWLRPSAQKIQRTSSRNWLKRDSPTAPLLKDAHVLSCKDALAWNWRVVRTILRFREDSSRILHDSDHKLFIKTLVMYFKPSSNKYSRVELGTRLAREATLAGCDLVNFLLEVQEPEDTILLEELIGDIADQITQITRRPTAHDCLFSPKRIAATCCQKYFLFLGQLSQSAKGTVILRAVDLLDKMETLVIGTLHDCYVKLIISSLDYTREGPNRKVLSNIISSASWEQTRVYATQFLRVLLRARITDTLPWVLTLLTERLKDKSRIVTLAALEALHEAGEDPVYLETLSNQGGLNRVWEEWPAPMWDRGYLLNIRFYSLRAEFTRLPSPAEELEKWIKPGGFAERYVGFIEGEIHDSFTRRQRGVDGSYFKRQSNMLVLPKDVFIPPHLLGQLVQHELGMQLLGRRNVVQRLAKTIQRFILDFTGTDNESISKATKSSRSAFSESHFMSEESGVDEPLDSTRLETIIDAEVMETVPRPFRKNSLHVINDSQRTTPEKTDDPDVSNTESRILRVKSALWAAGHYGTSPAGVEHLKHHKLIEMITNLAESCPYYAIRATAMYCLSLISTTRAGADALAIYDWPCIRYRRGDDWPIVKPSQQYSVPSPVPIQKHHRSLSDGKPELPASTVRRTRNRSESAATDIEAKRLGFSERGDTPSPGSSFQRLSQQDAEGYAKLRRYQMHRRPSFSHSSSEMYSSDGRLSLQSLSEFESSKSWSTDNAMSLAPIVVATREEDPSDTCYMGICMPRSLQMIFPETISRSSVVSESFSRCDESSQGDEDSLETENGDHWRICLVCYKGTSRWDEVLSEADTKFRKDTLKHVQRLSNPVWYRNSRQVLLRLRQRFPEKFQDTCLFSEVASRLGNGTYRLPARRFLQELFLDTTFDVLYLEPMKILRIPIGTEENPAQHIPSVLTTSSDLTTSPPKRRINGRVTIPEVESPSSTTSELTSETINIGAGLKTPETTEKTERLSDEKIIAEILKPVERLKISRSSDNKLLKITGTKTAISLD